MDKIFKIGVLVLGSLYLAYLFCPVANQTGRYSYHEGVDPEGFKSILAFDTSTGVVYRSSHLITIGDGIADIIRNGKSRESYNETNRKLRKEGIEIE